MFSLWYSGSLSNEAVSVSVTWVDRDKNFFVREWTVSVTWAWRERDVNVNVSVNVNVNVKNYDKTNKYNVKRCNNKQYKFYIFSIFVFKLTFLGV